LTTEVEDKTADVAQALQKKYPQVSVTEFAGVGKAAALKAGFEKSQGEWIFLIDSDNPYGDSFFSAALEKLREGADFVTANRRLRESVFRCPVHLLPLVYRRFRLGLWFNAMVRLFFKIPTTDTQAGSKAMVRAFAARAFALQKCPGFFADIEYFLVCSANRFKHAEVPIEFYLREEKTTVRLFREIFQTGYWLPRLYLQKHSGGYHAGP
jgi:glycosyltransferase involved in cell wall biosynthesis